MKFQATIGAGVKVGRFLDLKHYEIGEGLALNKLVGSQGVAQGQELPLPVTE